MAIERTTRRDGSFVVRIWWEPGTDPATGHWRGWVQHVRNGEQVSFQHMADLLAFIDALKPRSLAVESPAALPCRLTPGDVAAYYRTLRPYGRNDALFKAAIWARDDGQSEQWTLNALVEAHIKAVPPRGHRAPAALTLRNGPRMR